MAVTFLGSLSSDAEQTTYSLGNIVTSEAGLVVVGVGCRTSDGADRTVASATIGGTSATIVANPSYSNAAAIIQAELPAGTHALSVTFSGAAIRAGASAVLLTNYASATAHDSDAVGNNSTVANATITLDYPARGVGIYFVNKNGTGDVGWTAASEAAEQTVESVAVMALATKFVDTATGNTETCSWSTNRTNGASGVTYQLNADITSGRIVWLKGNGDVTDSSGNGFNGTATNITYTTGVNGQAMVFNGSSSHVLLPTALGWDTGGQYSIFTRFQLASRGDYEMLASQYSDANNRKEFHLGGSGLGSNAGLNMAVATSAVAMNAYVDSILSNGVTYSACNVVDLRAPTNATKGKIFLNAVEQTLTYSGTFPSALPAISASNTYLGRRSGSSLPLDGWQDDVILFDRALAPWDVTALHNYSESSGGVKSTTNSILTNSILTHGGLAV